MINEFIGILGIILSLIFGAYSVWAYRKSKQITSIDIKGEEGYSITKEDISRLNIEVTYNKLSLENSIMLLKIKLINSGSTDIDKSKIYKPLSIIIDKNYKWLEAKTVEQSSGVNSSLSILNSNELQIEWDLIKANESITLDLIVEVVEILVGMNEIRHFYHTLSFDFRITDLSKINLEKIKPSLLSKFNSFIYKNTRFIGVFIILFGLIICIPFFNPEINFFNFINKEIKYKIQNKEDSTIINSTITVTDSILVNSNKLELKSSLNQFNLKYNIVKIESIVNSKRHIRQNALSGLILILMGIFMIYASFKYKERGN